MKWQSKDACGGCGAAVVRTTAGWFRILLIFGWVAGSGSEDLLAAARGYHLRMFTAQDGLADNFAAAITVSPRGNVWVKHGEADRISVMDGYSFRTLESPGRDGFRVYESRTVQLWSLVSDGPVAGISVHDGQRWIPFTVPEILREMRLDPLRQVRQIPLVPAAQDRVLFLLSGRLMEFNAATKQTTLIRWVDETELGRFSEMAESQDGGLWVTGARGLAHVAGPVRQISPASTWEQFIAGGELPVENLQRPFEHAGGGVTVTVAAGHSEIRNQRMLLQWDGSDWRAYRVFGEMVRQAWTGWDGAIWGYTVSSLFRFEPNELGQLEREKIWVGQCKDVAADMNGVFWLATSEGVLHCAPYCWRTPRPAGAIDSVVHAMLEDEQGRFWFASSDSLVVLQEGQWRSFKWPEGFEASFHPTDGLFALPDGRVAIGSSEVPLLFDPEREQFGYVVHPEPGRVKLLGRLPDGPLCVQKWGTNGICRLEQFDGNSFRPVADLVAGEILSSDLYFATATENGDVWLGGEGGIGVWRKEGFHGFGPMEGFGDERVFCVLEIGDGRFWCGSNDRVWEYNGTSWKVVRSGLGRVNDFAKGTSGEIWVAASRGIYRVLGETWLQNGTEDGLPGSAVAEVQLDSSGRLWAGTSRGISLHHPEADLSPPRTLQPTLADGPKPLTEGEVTFLFHAVDKWDVTVPERLLFSFRLNEGQWSPYTNAASHTIPDMRAGKHRFEVRAMDRNGNEDLQGAVLEFSVLVPWYKETRLIVVSLCGFMLVFFFAALAVNRHLQLIRSYAEVERIVGERTRQLERANKELLHSQKMKALGALAAGVAHDFNNILSIIKGSVQIIEANTNDREKVLTRVNRIKMAVDQGAGIVHSMLGLSRTTEKDFGACDVNEVVERALKLLLDRFSSEVILRSETAPSLPRVGAVGELLQQMLVNLILNAVDAMGGRGEVVVRTGQKKTLPAQMALSPRPASRYAYVAVVDSGCGIDPAIRTRIFEPFFTTKGFSTRRGTGLGLSMVYELAKEMGHGLQVDSRVGEGSTFWIFMPLRDAGEGFGLNDGQEPG